VDPASFDRVVAAAVAELPSWAAEALRNVAVLVADEDPDDPDLYGVYDGVALPDREGGEPLQPSRIFIYRRPLVEDCRSEADLREEIRVTVLHEIGHHFGLDEDRLEELGYG
jgi:predicted Zn-dependent protease with MMP-like domain